MSLFPFLGFRDLADESIEQLDLDPEWQWSAFLWDWLGHGIVFFVHRKAPNHKWGGSE